MSREESRAAGLPGLPTSHLPLETAAEPLCETKPICPSRGLRSQKNRWGKPHPTRLRARWCWPCRAKQSQFRQSNLEGKCFMKKGLWQIRRAKGVGKTKPIPVPGTASPRGPGPIPPGFHGRARRTNKANWWSCRAKQSKLAAPRGTNKANLPMRPEMGAGRQGCHSGMWRQTKPIPARQVDARDLEETIRTKSDRYSRSGGHSSRRLEYSRLSIGTCCRWRQIEWHEA